VDQDGQNYRTCELTYRLDSHLPHPPPHSLSFSPDLPSWPLQLLLLDRSLSTPTHTESHSCQKLQQILPQTMDCTPPATPSNTRECSRHSTTLPSGVDTRVSGIGDKQDGLAADLV
jgi:hypothetical protein